MNEFGSLTPDELHFLRVFIYCEGRIRDMEAALGVSYPTVKGHLASIKAKLNLAGERLPAQSREAGDEQGTEDPADTVLDRLEKGELSYKDAVKLLRGKKKGAKGDEQASS